MRRIIKFVKYIFLISRSELKKSDFMEKKIFSIRYKINISPAEKTEELSRNSMKNVEL